MSEQITPNPSVPSQVVAEVKFPQFINNLGIIPTSYKDSMSYYECIVWLCKFLEEQVIPTVNENGKAVEELQTLYVELNSYVTNYFNNLDVQEEINNKLDQMVQTGELQQLLDLQYNNLRNEVNTIINNLNTSVESLDEKVSNSINMNPIVVTSSSDMTDTSKIYVLTTDGKWYYHNGTTWTAGGDYQSDVIANDSIDLININNSLRESNYIKTEYNCDGIGGLSTSTGNIDTSVTNRIYFEIETQYLNNFYFVLNNYKDLTITAVAFYIDDNYITFKNPTQAPISVFGNGIKINPYICNNIKIFAKKNSNASFTDDEISNYKIFEFINKNINIDNYMTINDNYIKHEKAFELGGISNIGQKVQSNQYATSRTIKFNNNNGTRNIKLENMNNLLHINFIVKYLNGVFVERQELSSFNYDNINITKDSSFNEIKLIIHIYQGGIISTDMLANINLIKKKEFNSNLEDEIYSALGDSITYGFIPRNYEGYPGQLNSYLPLACEKLGMIPENKGISGSTIANVTGRNPMCSRYNTLDNEAVIVSVMGGTNDIRNDVELGTISDSTNETFYGALKILAQGLYDKYYINQGTEKGQNKKIFFITPLKLLQTSASELGGTGTNYDMSLWCKAIKDVAEMYSFPVLDLQNVSQLNPALSETIQGTESGYTGKYNPYMTDGTHPTQEGQEIISNIVAGFIKSLY